MQKIDFEKTSQIVIHSHLGNRIGCLTSVSRKLLLISIELLEHVIHELTRNYSNLSRFTYIDSSIELELCYVDDLAAFVVIDFEFLSPDSPPPGDPVALVEFYQAFEDGAVLAVVEVPLYLKLALAFIGSDPHGRMEIWAMEQALARWFSRYRARPEALANEWVERYAGGNVEEYADDYGCVPPKKFAAGRPLHIGKSASEQDWLENSCGLIQSPEFFKNTDMLKKLYRIESHHIDNNISNRSRIDFLFSNSGDQSLSGTAKGTGKTCLLSNLHLSAMPDPTALSSQVECY